MLHDDFTDNFANHKVNKVIPSQLMWTACVAFLKIDKMTPFLKSLIGIPSSSHCNTSVGHTFKLFWSRCFAILKTTWRASKISIYSSLVVSDNVNAFFNISDISWFLCSHLVEEVSKVSSALHSSCSFSVIGNTQCLSLINRHLCFLLMSTGSHRLSGSLLMFGSNLCLGHKVPNKSFMPLLRML